MCEFILCPRLFDERMDGVFELYGLFKEVKSRTLFLFLLFAVS